MHYGAANLKPTGGVRPHTPKPSLLIYLSHLLVWTTRLKILARVHLVRHSCNIFISTVFFIASCQLCMTRNDCCAVGQGADKARTDKQ